MLANQRESIGEPAVEVPVSTSRGKMNTKLILFWPKPRSDIERHLDREADDFLVVDTNSAYELRGRSPRWHRHGSVGMSATTAMAVLGVCA